ncbi:Longitudinals lacking protein, isoforms A/B/D/L [Frankliniella fusca]|uniref:Longitudinals lacking protein, isoforms A/B/D/L n=1 Tax=Frankliniella fusca TaxID=407009 RepID=A0AAE1H6G7_9NEOP|nr:Longitudinals lacking protein, isoforms A/B/D/L [Frankliniella fusca]
MWLIVSKASFTSDGVNVIVVTRTRSVNQEPTHRCEQCSRVYSHHSSLRNHQKFECGKPAQFGCPLCQYRCKRKGNLKSHIRNVH